MKYRIPTKNPELHYLYVTKPVHKLGDKQIMILARLMQLGDSSTKNRSVLVKEGFCSSLQVVANYVKLFRSKKFIDDNNKILITVDNTITYEIVENTKEVK